MNESELKLQFGEPLQITPRLHIKQPTIKEIEKMDGITSSDGLEYNITTLMGKIISSANLLSGL